MMIDFIECAKSVFKIEAAAVADLVNKVDSNFKVAVENILNTKGRVIVCGMGKSGIVGRKIAATLTSTGTPSFFMHPGEAYHGDLGMVTSSDIFIAISNSGETQELLKLIPFLKDNKNFLISLTGNGRSTLALAANAHIDVGVFEEACPLKLAPTASTTATLAMGDALAVTLMKARDFRPENFARFHPGGSLGKRLLSRVEDEMLTENLPFVNSASSLLEVIQSITRGKLGLVIVSDVPGYGVITDGDVRRLIERFKEKAFNITALDIMSKNPVSVSIGTRFEDAIGIMDTKQISSLLVVSNGSIVGVFKK